jgi:signal transduction histidine kinase/CheY-like chemotaxis protein
MDPILQLKPDFPPLSARRRPMFFRSIRTRLRLAAGGIAVMLLCAAWLGRLSVSRLSQDIERLVAEAAQVQALTSRFALDVADELRAAEQYLARPDTTVAQQFTDRGRDAHLVQSILVRLELRSAARGDASNAEVIARVDAELSRLESAYARAHRLIDLGDSEAARAALTSLDLDESGLRRDLELLSTKQSRRFVELSAALRRAAIARASLLAFILLGAVGVIGVFAWRLGRSISRPLEALVSHAEALHRGARDVRTEPDGFVKEFEVLAAAMNSATESLASLARTEAALHQAEKLAAIGTLISGVAHELNNPLQTILLTAEYLEDTAATDDARESVRTINEQVDRARTIIRDLLTTVRQDNEARDVAPLELTLRGIERELERIGQRHGANVDVTIDAPLPPLLVDRVGLVQVVTNLVDNAAFAAGRDGRVTLKARRTCTGCEIVVEDSGPGIPAALLGRIFEPFFSTKEVGKGTGLGLSVSRGIIESMHGTLTASSHWGGPSTGARFCVALPTLGGRIAPPERASPAPQAAPRSVVPRPSVRVRQPSPRMLVIDDEPAITTMMRRRFAASGWTVDVATNGAEGVAQIEDCDARGERYDVIFCDLRMPTMSGIEVHDILERRCPHTVDALVFLSGDLVSSDVAEFIARSSCRILSKPVELRALDEVAHTLAYRERFGGRRASA